MKSFVSNLTLARKLGLLLALPLTMLAWLTVERLTQSWQQWQLANQVEVVVEVIGNIASLVDALQAERDYSYVFRSSSGTSFADQVTLSQQKTDQELARTGSLDQAALQDFRQKLAQLREVRQQVDQLRIDPAQLGDYYTTTIAALLAYTESLRKQVEHPDIARQLAVLNSFMEAKERAGRERAILARAFEMAYMDKFALERFNLNQGAYQNLQERLQDLMSDKWRGEYRQLLQSPAFAEVARARESILKSAEEQPLADMDAEGWFSVASAALGLISDFEGRLTDEVLASSDTLEESSQEAFWMTLLALLAVFGLVLWLVVIIVRGLVGSVDAIRRQMQALEQGDLTQRTRMTNRDELGHIARMADGVALRLAEIIVEIRGATTQVATSAEEASAITLQTSEGVHRQRQDIELIATAIHEMNATVRGVARSTAEAACLSVQARDNADTGQNKLQHTIDLIGVLSVQVDSTAATINRVKQSSDSITSVLDVIKGIAEQTNLLALNAAIEAARAGEQGRGFAVVADEVRSLAQRTSQSTGEIQRMIEALQQSTGAAEVAMHQSLAQAREGLTIVNETGAVLSRAIEGISAINDRSIEIASAAEEQSIVVEEINQKVVSISEVAMQSSAGAEQTAVTSRELARLAEGLSELISRFKVD
ncbi:methyl-accepting chemotaxis protein [Pseudomonas sp. J452]|nr:methyl-accepting chemotaxis protein [Pseudomonas sp. J452]UUY08646.1 methyl-accepting chemotaxis protein [Pseudomonas sp. J452]